MKKIKKKEKKQQQYLMNSIAPKLNFIIQIIVRYPDEFMNEMLTYKLNSKICLMKGFVLEGYPKNIENA